MQKFMPTFFNFLRSFFHFLKIIIVFCIFMLLFYWIQDLINGDWGWLGFISPFFEFLLKISEKISSDSFDLFGAIFEFKYFYALLILVASFFLMNLFTSFVDFIEKIYISVCMVCKKTEEAIINKSLQDHVENQEKKIKKYSILIHTQLKKKYAHEELRIDINEQNKLMNKFLIEKFSIQPMILDGGYLYNFNDFDNIDNVLDVLFKVLKSNAPLNYAICIQVNNNLEQLKKLASLKQFRKITIAADTAYRYRFNETHRYQTGQIGLYQWNEKTIEVHEFKQIL